MYRGAQPPMSLCWVWGIPPRMYAWGNSTPPLCFNVEELYPLCLVGGEGVPLVRLWPESSLAYTNWMVLGSLPLLHVES